MLVLWRVIHQDDLLDKAPRGAVDDGVYCPEKRCPGFVVEDYNNAGCGKQWGVGFGLASEK